MASRDGLTASVVHLFNHGITKGALFLLLGGVALRAGAARLDRVRGLGRAMPWTSLGIVIAGLSLIGVPGHRRFRHQVVPGARRDRGRTLVARRAW